MLSHILIPAILTAAPSPSALLADNLSLGPACDANDTGRLWAKVPVTPEAVAMLFLQPACVPSTVWQDLVMWHGDVLAFVSRRVLARTHSVDIPELRREMDRSRQVRAWRTAVARAGGDPDALPRAETDAEAKEAAGLGGVRYGVVQGLVDVACYHARKHPRSAPWPEAVWKGSPINRDGLEGMCALVPVLRSLDTELVEVGRDAHRDGTR